MRNHQPGTLAGLAEYLHKRTGGMIGSLSHLVRGAAIDAILDHTEHITRAHLQTVRIDHAAETYSATRPAPAPAPTEPPATGTVACDCGPPACR